MMCKGIKKSVACSIVCHFGRAPDRRDTRVHNKMVELRELSCECVQDPGTTDLRIKNSAQGTVVHILQCIERKYACSVDNTTKRALIFVCGFNHLVHASCVRYVSSKHVNRSTLCFKLLQP